MTEIERLQTYVDLLTDELARERRMRREAEESRDAYAEWARLVRQDTETATYSGAAEVTNLHYRGLEIKA